MHKMNNCRYTKCLPKCSAQICKYDNQEAVNLFNVMNIQVSYSKSIIPER